MTMTITIESQAARANDLAEYYSSLAANLRETSPSAEAPGVYWTDGTLYKVQISKSSGRPYAKREAPGSSWEYAPGVIYSLKACDLLTLDQAKAYGRATGVCVCCGRDLSDPVSVEAGIGPVCEARWYGTGARKARKATSAKAAA